MYEPHERHRHGGPRRPTREGGAAADAFGELAGAGGAPRGGGGGAHGHGRARGRGGRARRGEVLAAVLALLSERPMHGYEIIQELSERTNGIWKVSSGSIYPAMQKLADKGYVLSEEEAGKKRFTLTESGRSLAEKIASRLTPWEAFLDDVDPETTRLRQAVHDLVGAAGQIGQVGTSEQQAEAAALLGETRRRLYGILAAEAREPGTD